MHMAMVRLAAVVLAALVIPPADTLAQGTDTSNKTGRARAAVFRGGTELVVLQVSVVDPQGRYTPNLQQQDFAVYEDGAPQTITMFGTSAAPLDLMLLMDTSASMYARWGSAQDAAIGLLRRLRAGDRGAVILFGDDVRIAQPFTGDIPALEAGVRDAAPNGGTALHEALYIALRELDRVHRTGGQLRRQALVVLSDGEDTSSRRVAFDDVLREARRSAVTVYSIMPAPSEEWTWVAPLDGRNLGAEVDMRTLAEDTGGRAFAHARTEDLSKMYRLIADELAQQYWLAYAPTSNSTQFRHVLVRLPSSPVLRARTRSGYYGKTRGAASSSSHGATER